MFLRRSVEHTEVLVLRKWTRVLLFGYWAGLCVCVSQTANGTRWFPVSLPSLCPLASSTRWERARAHTHMQDEWDVTYTPTAALCDVTPK